MYHQTKKYAASVYFINIEIKVVHTTNKNVLCMIFVIHYTNLLINTNASTYSFLKKHRIKLPNINKFVLQNVVFIGMY